MSRLENYCATGSEAFRNAQCVLCRGLRRLRYAMAIGVEKLKDSGFSGLVGTRASLTAPAMFSLLPPAYATKHGVDAAQLKDVMTCIAWNPHAT